MANATRKGWSYSAGERGRNRVRAYEDVARGTIFLEFYETVLGTEEVQRTRVSTGGNDRAAARRKANQLAAQFSNVEKPRVEEATLGKLFDIYSAILVWLVGPVGDFGATVPSLPIAQSFVVEMGFTAILGFVIMGVATDERTPPAVAPFAIGGTVYAGALVTGPLTGGSFNPARTLGPAVVGGIWTVHWLYWLAPIIGMIGAMHLYNALRGQATATARSAPPTGTEGPIDDAA